MNLIIRLFITAICAFLLTKILPGVQFDGFGTAIVFAIVLGILNIVVKPILNLFGLPLTILTLGLFSLVINAVIILMAKGLIDGMEVDGFLWAFIYSIALSAVTSLANSFVGDKD